MITRRAALTHLARAALAAPFTAAQALTHQPAPDIPPVQPGDVFTAAGYNQLIKRVNELSHRP